MMATAALALTFAGCSKNDEPEDELKPEVHVGKVEVSSSQVVFPVDGGSKTIAVATNAEWHLDCDYTWMSFDADLNSGTVTISAEKNTTGADRYGVISVICGDEGYTDSRDIRVMQTYEPEDLVKDGVTANCYIAHTKASYRFPAKVKGNGAGDGNSKYIAAEGLEIKNAAFAELVWEAVPDGDKTRSTYVIDGEPMYDGENVYFSTGKAAGNAVIAVCAADGTILWSWHIWVTDDEITTKTDKNGLVWMDRNLGALSAKPSDAVNTRGLFYQWGRKDPFLPSAAEFVDIPTIYYADDDATANAKYAEQVKLRPSANVANQQKGDGVRRINAEKAVVAYSAPGNAVYAVQHPETFLTIHPVYSGGIKCDWYIMSPDNSEETDDQTESNLWGNTSSDVKYKSIFDPCPAGWRVCNKAEAQSFMQTVFNSATLAANLVGYDFDGHYLPMTDSRSNKHFRTETVKSCGYETKSYMWTSESVKTHNYGYAYAAAMVAPANYADKNQPKTLKEVKFEDNKYLASSCPVRCVKE